MPENEVPSNGVLLAKLESMSAVVLANQITNHDAQVTIIAQVTKTNGRVGVLEMKDAERVGEMRILKWLVGTLLLPLAFLIIKSIWFK